MSVIRLQGLEKEPLVQAANEILGKCSEYSESVQVVAVTPDGTPHHTITPIARKREACLNWI